MPLQSGSSQKVISSNIDELTHHGSRPRSHDQIVAIALHNADKHPRADGGMVPLKRAFGGLNQIGSNWEERAEERGAQNTPTGFLHGFTPGRADKIQTASPAGSYVLPADVISGVGQGNSLAGASAVSRMLSSGPYGVKISRIGGGHTIPRAKGGSVPKDVPVMLSHGEFVISPEQVKSIGGGNAKNGFKVLDELVKELRRRHIKKLQKLPGPAK